MKKQTQHYIFHIEYKGSVLENRFPFYNRLTTSFLGPITDKLTERQFAEIIQLGLQKLFPDCIITSEDEHRRLINQHV